MALPIPFDEQPASSLIEGALWIASDAYPGLDRSRQHQRLDELAAPLIAERVGELTALAQAQALGAHLNRDCGFRGNRADYHDPDNSFVNVVLERRLGIPISLAVVYIEVARRAGVRASGVGFPGHFLVRIDDDHDRVMLDPFSSRALSRLELQELLGQATRGRLELCDAMLEPTPTRHVLARMLYNLRFAYAQRNDRQRLLVTLDRLVDLLPEAVEHRRDRGLLCARFGAVAAAWADLNAYLAAMPNAADADEVKSVLSALCGAPLN